MKILYFWILISAVVVALGGHIAYWEKFGTILDADTREAWGLYGDYIGGTVGTFFTFATLMGVVATLWLQNRQIDHMELNSERVARHFGADEIGKQMEQAWRETPAG